MSTPLTAEAHALRTRRSTRRDTATDTADDDNRAFKKTPPVAPGGLNAEPMSPTFEAKFSLGFILNEPQPPRAPQEEPGAPTPATSREANPSASQSSVGTFSEAQEQRYRSPKTTTPQRRSRAPVRTEAAAAASAPALAAAKKPRRGVKRQMTYEETRLARKCTIDGCTNYTINRGLCFRHGGGKTCTVEGCSASAKIAGLCWKHGGSVQCVVEGCDRRGKSRGLCWAHGGGTKCQGDGCSKVAVSSGFCWAHGGGKRCLYSGCQRPAYERTLNYCPKHYSRFEHGQEVMEV